MKSRCNLVVESPLKIANTLCCVGFPPGMMNIGRTLVSTKVEYAAFWKVRPMPLTAIRYAVIPLERKSVFLGWKLYVEHIHCVCRFMRPLTLGQINKSSVNQFASMSSGALGVLFDSLYAAILFRYQTSLMHYAFFLNGNKIQFWRVNKTERTMLAQTPFEYNGDEYYTISVVCKGNTFTGAVMLVCGFMMRTLIYYGSLPTTIRVISHTRMISTGMGRMKFSAATT